MWVRVPLRVPFLKLAVDLLFSNGYVVGNRGEYMKRYIVEYNVAGQTCMVPFSTWLDVEVFITTIGPSNFLSIAEYEV